MPLIDINELAKRLSIPEGTVSHVTALMSLRFGVSAMELMTIKEVAKKLGVSENWVYSHLRAREPLVPHVRLGGNIRFREEDIDVWIEEQVRNVMRTGAS
jgi:excisionase family DNA binding protein